MTDMMDDMDYWLCAEIIDENLFNDGELLNKMTNAALPTATLTRTHHSDSDSCSCASSAGAFCSGSATAVQEPPEPVRNAVAPSVYSGPTIRDVEKALASSSSTRRRCASRPSLYVRRRSRSWGMHAESNRYTARVRTQEQRKKAAERWIQVEEVRAEANQEQPTPQELL